jgi:hypothetical protein
MSQKQSFTGVENDLLPKFRKMTNEAESTEDVKKFFAYCMQELFTQVFAGQLELDFDDIGLLPEGEGSFHISERIRAREDFARIWTGSDLPHILARFTELALNRYKHLAKNPRKTEAKIRM